MTTLKKFAGFKYRKKAWLLILVFVFIGFNQFPIINIGGKLKIYDLLGIYILFKYKHSCPKNFTMLGFLILFIVSPLLSFISSLFIEIPSNFYFKYPEALNSIKFGSKIFSILQMLFAFYNFAVVVAIYREKSLYENLSSWMRKIIIIATAISVYSIISAFTIDVIATYFPKIIQNFAKQPFRSHGFFMEPGYYIPYQTWITLFAFALRKTFKYGNIIFIINALSLLLTMSSVLAALFLVLITVPFIFKTSFKVRITTIAAITLFAVSLYVCLEHFGLTNMALYVLFEKIENFFTSPEHTLDSGAFRNFTSRIGLEIFGLYPITGVGVGNSVFYMHLFEYKMGIVTWGEELSLGVMPLSLFSSLLAEQGIIGGIALVMVIFGTIITLWKYKNKGYYSKYFLIGGLVNIGSMFSIPMVYSLYLWVFLALGLGYCNYINNQGKAKKYVHSQDIID